VPHNTLKRKFVFRMVKGDLIDENTELTASQEEMPPPGIPHKRGPLTRSQTAAEGSRLQDRTSQFKPTVTTEEMKAKRLEEQKQQHQQEKQKQIEQIRGLAAKLSPTKTSSLKGTPSRAMDTGAFSEKTSLHSLATPADQSASSSTKPQLESVPPLPAHETQTSEKSSGSTGSAAGTSDSKVMDMLTEIMSKMVTKDDVSELKSDLLNHTEAAVEKAIEPLKTEIAEIKTRLSAVERRTNTVQFDPNDVAFRRVDLVGFKDITNNDVRIREVESLIARLSKHRPVHYGTNMKGKWNNRQMTNSCYIEFGTTDARDAFFRDAKDIELNCEGAKIKLMTGISKFKRARNWALMTAKDLISKEANGQGAIADKKERVVKVGGNVVFTQLKHESHGSFVCPFDHLRLPV